MDGFVSLNKNEQFKGNIFNGFSRDIANNARDCGLVDSCSPFYRSHIRAVRWLAEQCESFFGDSQCNGIDNFIKDIMFGKISPDNDNYVLPNSQVLPNERSSAVPGIWLEDKTARLIREVQRDFDLRNDSKYFGQYKAPCGRNLDEIRSQFYVDCYSECVQPQGCRMKANTTECVPVPSSEHVAEIVGKKGKYAPISYQRALPAPSVRRRTSAGLGNHIYVHFSLVSRLGWDSVRYPAPPPIGMATPMLLPCSYLISLSQM